MSAGIVLNVYDNYEKINYSQDDEAVNQEVVIIKFRGFDFPNVFTKKDETRYSYNNGYFGDLTFQYELENLISISAYAGGGFQKTMIKDNANKPSPDGFWKDNVYRGGIYAVSNAFEKLKLGFAYKISNNNSWASNPDYQSTYMENLWTDNSFLLGAQYPFTEQINIGLETGIDFFKRNDDDYYSHVFSNSRFNNLKASLGLRI